MTPSIVATVLGFALLATPADAQESPLISWFRHSFGPTVGEIAIVEARPVDYHGKSNIVLVRSVPKNSPAIRFHVYVVNEAMTNVERPVESWTAPWPDFAARIDRVTPDSVYVTGTSAG